MKTWTTPDYDQITRDRLSLLYKANRDIELQALIVEYCSKDVVTWINDWCWTYDPRVKPSILPLRLFPIQEEYLLWRQQVRENKENGLCEKSRDMGASWLNSAHQMHCWLFEDNFKGAIGSRKQDLVDRIGDPDSIFEKLRFLLRYLPAWMRPKGFDWSKHDNFCKLTNPDNGSTITGEAGDNIGRGGRSSIYDLDEAAFIERASKVDAALSNNTDVIFYTSSANGMGTPFYKKRTSYAPQLIFTMHWRKDPRKDDAWYAKQKERFEPIVVASEIDIDYGASVEGIYIPSEWVRAAIELDLKPSGDTIAALDVAASGSNSNVFGTKRGPVVEFIEAWKGLDTTQSAYKARELMQQLGANHLSFDADGVGAGVAGTLASIPNLEFRFTGLHGTSSPSDRYWPGEERTSKEKFENARAEWWGLLHDRFKRTFDHVTGVKTYPDDELISIPNHPLLVAQISMPKRKFTNKGKTLIESKLEMRARGVESPDYADMLAYLFSETFIFDLSEAKVGTRRSSSSGDWRGY